jgi:hypothetical protein
MFERRERGCREVERRQDWVADVGWKYLGTPRVRARESTNFRSKAVDGSARGWRSGVTSPKESVSSVERREIEEAGRTGTWVGAFEGILRTQVNAARAMQVERAPDTTEGALGVESGMPLTGRSRKHPGAAGLRCSALV